jgi:hypothetical protein
MKGGHFVYALYRQEDDLLMLPNVAYISEYAANQAIKDMTRTHPGENWQMKTIWVPHELAHGDRS